MRKVCCAICNYMQTKSTSTFNHRKLCTSILTARLGATYPYHTAHCEHWLNIDKAILILHVVLCMLMTFKHRYAGKSIQKFGLTRCTNSKLLKSQAEAHYCANSMWSMVWCANAADFWSKLNVNCGVMCTQGLGRGHFMPQASAGSAQAAGKGATSQHWDGFEPGRVSDLYIF